MKANVTLTNNIISGFGLYDENETNRADSNLQSVTKRERKNLNMSV